MIDLTIGCDHKYMPFCDTAVNTGRNSFGPKPCGSAQLSVSCECSPASDP